MNIRMNRNPHEEITEIKGYAPKFQPPDTAFLKIIKKVNALIGNFLLCFVLWITHISSKEQRKT